MSSGTRNWFYFQEYYQRNREHILLQRKLRYQKEHGIPADSESSLTTNIQVWVEGNTVLIPLYDLFQALIFNHEPRFTGLPDPTIDLNKEIRDGNWRII